MNGRLKLSIVVAMGLSAALSSACIEQSNLGAICFEDADCVSSVCIFVPGELEGLCLDEDEGCAVISEVRRTQVILSAATIASFLPPQGNTCVRLVGDLIVEPAGVASELVSLDGMERLLEVSGNIRIRDNENLTDIGGLSHLRRVGGDISIASNPALAAIELSRLYSVQSFEISGSNSLRELDGLESLTLVEGSLNVAGNPNLRSISGLSSLLSIGGDLEIHDNANLEELGFDRLSSVAGQIAIFQNPRLPQCEALALAADLGNADATINTNDETASCLDVDVIGE